jgi:hypothetical protein
MHFDPTALVAVARADSSADDPALMLFAALIAQAKRDEAKGVLSARRWLNEYVEPAAAELVARGRVRVAA